MLIRLVCLSIQKREKQLPRHVHLSMLWKTNNNLEVFIQACEGKQRIIMLFVIHRIAKRKTKHLSIFDHPSNYEKKKKVKENPLDIFI